MASEFDVLLSGYYADEEPSDRRLPSGTRDRPAKGLFFFDFANRAMKSGREVVLVAEGDGAAEAMERIKDLLEKPIGPARTRERTLLWYEAQQGKDWMPPLVAAVLSLASPSSKDSRLHGLSHWARVAAIGLVLADQAPPGDLGADTFTLLLFSLLHDSMRENDGHDPDHGRRAAELARTMRDEGAFDLDDARMALLEEACIHHDKGATSRDPTIGACWDSDRLDLWRVGKRPDPALLSTQAARSMVETTRGYGYSGIRFDWRAIFLTYAAAAPSEAGGAVYIRFGELPPGGRSAVPLVSREELGVSAFLAHEHEGRYRIDLRALLMGTESRFIRGLLCQGRPAYQLQGKRVGVGGLGEPLLASSDARIVSEVPPEKLDISPEWLEVTAALSWWRRKRKGENPGPPPRDWWRSLPGDRALAPMDYGGPVGEGFWGAAERMKREKFRQWGLLETYEEAQQERRQKAKEAALAKASLQTIQKSWNPNWGPSPGSPWKGG